MAIRSILAGLSHETLTLARRLDVHVVAVCDPQVAPGEWLGLPAFNADSACLSATLADGVILAIDMPSVRAKVQDRYAEAGLPAIDLIGGFIEEGTSYGCGLLLQRDASISTDCRLGRGVRLNVGAVVMHDCDLGDHVTIAPRAVVLGRVVIGARTYVGANATVLPGVRIGADCVVGAGAVVTRDIPDRTVVKGVPAR